VSPSRARLPTDAVTSARMKRVRRHGTDLELIVRRYLWHRGLRFSVQNWELPGSPDIANRKRRWAVFVHGCYWHGHRRCQLGRAPKTNQEFWAAKVRDNRRRDAAKVKQLLALGFVVVTVWGCRVKCLLKTNRLAELDLLFRASAGRTRAIRSRSAGRMH
jgi:DNA mismatch endonuclease Vsr